MAKTKMPPPTPEDFDWQAAALQQRHLALLPTSSPQELAYQKWHRGNRTERSWSQLSFMERAEWAQFYFDIETQDLYWKVDEQAQYRTSTRWTFFCKNKSEKDYVSPYQKLEEWQWKMEVEKVEAAKEPVGEMKTYGLPGYVSPYAMFTQIEKRRVQEYKSPYAMSWQMGMGAGYQKAVIPKKRLIKAAARKQQNLGTGEQGTNGPGIARELLAAIPEVSKKRARPVARKSRPSADEQGALVPRAIALNPVPHVELTGTPSALAARFLSPSTIAPGTFYRSSFPASTRGPVTRPNILAPTTTAPNSIPPRALSQNPSTSHTLKPNPFAPMIATPRIEPPIHQFSRELPKAILFHSKIPPPSLFEEILTKNVVYRAKL